MFCDYDQDVFCHDSHCKMHGGYIWLAFHLINIAIWTDLVIACIRHKEPHRIKVFFTYAMFIMILTEVYLSRVIKLKDSLLSIIYSWSVIKKRQRSKLMLHEYAHDTRLHAYEALLEYAEPRRVVYAGSCEVRRS